MPRRRAPRPPVNQPKPAAASAGPAAVPAQFISCDPQKVVKDFVMNRRRINKAEGQYENTGIDTRVLVKHYNKKIKRRPDGYAELGFVTDKMTMTDTPLLEGHEIIAERRPEPKPGQRKQYTMQKALPPYISWVKYKDLAKNQKDQADDAANFTVEAIEQNIGTTRQAIRAIAMERFAKGEYGDLKNYKIDYFIDRGIDDKGQHWLLAAWSPVWAKLSKIKNYATLPKNYEEKRSGDDQNSSFPLGIRKARKTNNSLGGLEVNADQANDQVVVQQLPIVNQNEDAGHRRNGNFQVNDDQVEIVPRPLDPAVAVPVAVPEVAVPVAVPEVAVPVAVPEVAVPVAAPEVVVPVAVPEVAVPVAVPEVAVPVAVPEVAVPVAVPEVVAPVAAPEVVVPVAVPEVAVPVAIPEIAVPVAVPEAAVPAAIPAVAVPVAAPEVAAPAAILEVVAPVAIPAVAAPAAIPEVVVPVAIPEVAVPVAISAVAVPVAIPAVAVPVAIDLVANVEERPEDELEQRPVDDDQTDDDQSDDDQTDDDQPDDDKEEDAQGVAHRVGEEGHQAGVVVAEQGLDDQDENDQVPVVALPVVEEERLIRNEVAELRPDDQVENGHIPVAVIPDVGASKQLAVVNNQGLLAGWVNPNILLVEDDGLMNADAYIEQLYDERNQQDPRLFNDQPPQIPAIASMESTVGAVQADVQILVSDPLEMHPVCEVLTDHQAGVAWQRSNGNDQVTGDQAAGGHVDVLPVVARMEVDGAEDGEMDQRPSSHSSQAQVVIPSIGREEHQVEFGEAAGDHLAADHLFDQMAVGEDHYAENDMNGLEDEFLFNDPYGDYLAPIPHDHPYLIVELNTGSDDSYRLPPVDIDMELDLNSQSEGQQWQDQWAFREPTHLPGQSLTQMFNQAMGEDGHGWQINMNRLNMMNHRVHFDFDQYNPRYNGTFQNFYPDMQLGEQLCNQTYTQVQRHLNFLTGSQPTST